MLCLSVWLRRSHGAGGLWHGAHHPVLSMTSLDESTVGTLAPEGKRGRRYAYVDGVIVSQLRGLLLAPEHQQ
jgi:hypothetical protein